jgi:exosome complex component RRP4
MLSTPCFLAEVRTKEDLVSNFDTQANLVLPGQVVTTQQGFIRGYGTYTPDQAEPTLTATVSGHVLRVNKLLGVTPFRARYKGDVGDVVVGRVVDVQQKRWKLDLGASQHAVLMLR